MTAKIVFTASKPPHPRDAEILKARRAAINGIKRAVVSDENKKIGVVKYK